MLLAVHPIACPQPLACISARQLLEMASSLLPPRVVGGAIATYHSTRFAPRRSGQSGVPMTAPSVRTARRAFRKESLQLVSRPVLQRIASGEPGAVQECIDRYAGLVWSLARRMASNNADAEDAVQEILTEVWRNAYRYDESIASETAFIAMIARRRLIDRRRRTDRQKDRSALPEDPPAATDASAGRAELGEEARLAARALEELSSEQQRVLRLSIYQGLSHEKIAVATGLPLGTVKTHARRGLIRVRELLARMRPSLSSAGEVNS